MTGATELPCIRLRQEVDLRCGAIATTNVERSVWLGFTQPFRIDDWRKVDWPKCAQLRQFDLAGRLVSLAPGTNAAATLAAMDLNLCLARLQHLSLEQNSLGALPEGISALTALRTLSLYQNSLSALPEGISALTALTMLFLHKNSLSALPEGISALTALQMPTLAQNSLSALPEGISALTALHTLSLQENAAFSVPPHGLLTLTVLRELHIDNVQQHRFGLFWAPLVHAITVHPVERGAEPRPTQRSFRSRLR